jgi:hypothetical protein
LTCGFEIELDREPDVVSAFALLFDPEVEVCAKAAPHRMVSAPAVIRSDLIRSLL